MTDDQYYKDREYLTNSLLTDIKYKYLGLSESEKQLEAKEKAFFRGNLFDDAVTMTVERSRISVPKVYRGKSVEESDYRRTREMIEVLMKDRFCRNIVENASHQEILMSDKFPYSHDLDSGTVKMKGKTDFFLPFLIADLKSTSCKTQKSFEASVKLFSYNRQASIYMDLAGINKFLIIGVSKENLKLFKVAINRGDELYNLGVKQRNELISICNISL